jgi:hypothetical protein
LRRVEWRAEENENVLEEFIARDARVGPSIAFAASIRNVTAVVEWAE